MTTCVYLGASSSSSKVITVLVELSPGLGICKGKREAQVKFNSFPDDNILDWSKLKQIADDISKCF